jgi:cation:H+ antiporter
MNLLMLYYFKFALAAMLVVYSGLKLSGIATQIRNKTNVSEIIMGGVFVAITTSLPEIFTSFSALLKTANVNLAVGDITGSVFFNLSIIGFLGILIGVKNIFSEREKHKKLFTELSTNQIANLVFNILLLVILGASILLRSVFNYRPPGKLISVDNLLIIIICIFIARLIFKNELNNTKKTNNNFNKSIFYLWLKFFIFVGLIFWGGIHLSDFGAKIVRLRGLDSSWFGNVFLGITTSLPELITSTSMLFAGQANMAIANILGSNVFDLALIPVMDIVWGKDQLLNLFSVSNLIIITSSIVICIILIIGLKFSRKLRPVFLNWTISISIIITSLSSFWYFYLLTSRN